MANDGIDYFPLNCRLDEKFELIEAEFGIKGFAIVVKLFQRIYGEHGYYCEWNNDISLIFAKQIGFSYIGDSGLLGGADLSSPSGRPKNIIDLVVTAAIRRGIFDKKLYEKSGILTSKGIQKNFLNATSRRKRVELEKAYLLLSADNFKDNVYIIGENVYRNQKNAYISEQSKVKESKVNTLERPETHEDEKPKLDEKQLINKENFEKIYAIYPVKKGKQNAFKHYTSWGNGTKKNDFGIKRLSNRQMYIAVKRYVDEMVEKGKEEYIAHFSTFMNNAIIDYLDDGSEK